MEQPTVLRVANVKPHGACAKTYMKADALVENDRVATTFFGSTLERRIDGTVDKANH